MEEIKYNLKEFYEKRPPFEQTVPMYHEMPEHMPTLKLEFPIMKNKADISVGFEKTKKDKHELEREKNEAYANVCQSNKDYEHSMWKHFKELTFNK